MARPALRRVDTSPATSDAWRTDGPGIGISAQTNRRSQRTDVVGTNSPSSASARSSPKTSAGPSWVFSRRARSVASCRVPRRAVAAPRKRAPTSSSDAPGHAATTQASYTTSRPRMVRLPDSACAGLATTPRHVQRRRDHRFRRCNRLLRHLIHGPGASWPSATAAGSATAGRPRDHADGTHQSHPAEILQSPAAHTDFASPLLTPESRFSERAHQAAINASVCCLHRRETSAFDNALDAHVERV